MHVYFKLIQKCAQCGVTGFTEAAVTTLWNVTVTGSKLLSGPS